MKTIAILGSTGSIGTQTLEVVRANGDIRVAALAAGKNIKLLEQQIREFRPRLAAVADEEDAKALKMAVADLSVEILFGEEGREAVAVCEEAEILVTAIVGMIGILPTVACDRGRKGYCAGKQRNAGDGRPVIIMPLRKGKGSEDPSGGQRAQRDIFQALHGEDSRAIR